MTHAALKDRLTLLLAAVEASGVVRVDIYHESFRSMIREAIAALSAMEGEGEAVKEEYSESP